MLYTLLENDFGKINAFSLSGLIFCAVAILLCVYIEESFWTAAEVAVVTVTGAVVWVGLPFLVTFVFKLFDL